MKTAELKELSIKEINERIDNEKSMLIKMKFNHHISPLDNPLKLRRTRRLVATLVTELRSRELKEQNK